MSDDILTTTIPLSRAIEHDGRRHDSLTIREATVGDQMDAVLPGMTQAEAEVALVAHLAGVPAVVIRRMRLADYRKVQAVIQNFPYPDPKDSAATS